MQTDVHTERLKHNTQDNKNAGGRLHSNRCKEVY